MNTATFAPFLAVLVLALGATVVLLAVLKHRSEQALNQRLLSLQDQLNVASKAQGGLEQLENSLRDAKEAKAKADQANTGLQDELRELQGQLSKAQEAEESAKSYASELIQKERESNARVVEAKQEQITALREFIDKSKEVLGTQFKALSADALKEVLEQLNKATDGLIEKHSEKTTLNVKLQKKEIETMLKPVEETLRRLDKQVEDTNVERAKAEKLLDDQISRLTGASESLTNALKKPVIRGSWGEMTLENALESAGLQPEIDYVLQHTTEDEDGRQRTDAVLSLPKGRKLVIDSKNLMETYIAFSKEDDPIKKEELANQHSRAFRTYMRSLSSKEYWKRYEGLDCVIMFIPHEGMFNSAISDEADLIREMNTRRVYVANPVTLIPLLKAIRYILDQEKLNMSAIEISQLGTDLYAKIGDYTGKVANLGRSIRLTVDAYNKALPALDRFIVSKARSLKQLGAGKGAEPQVPDAIEIEPRTFSSRELREFNPVLDSDAEEIETQIPD